MSNKKGLGDKVENIIKNVAPNFAKSKENCKRCKRTKEWLNNFNSNFS